MINSLNSTASSSSLLTLMNLDNSTRKSSMSSSSKVFIRANNTSNNTNKNRQESCFDALQNSYKLSTLNPNSSLNLPVNSRNSIWSSNISLKSLSSQLTDHEVVTQEEDENRSTNIDNKSCNSRLCVKAELSYSAQISNNRSEQMLNDLHVQQVRPLTARSLPTKCVENEFAEYNLDSYSIRSNRASLTTDRSLMNSLNHSNVFKSQASKSDLFNTKKTLNNTGKMGKQNESETAKADKKFELSSPNDKENNKNYLKVAKHSNSFKKLVNSKSNMDIFLEYSTSPFITKFELSDQSVPTTTSEKISNLSKSKQRTFSSLKNLSSSNLNSSDRMLAITSQFDEYKERKANSSKNNLYPMIITMNDDFLFDSNQKGSNFVKICQNILIGDMNSLKNERKLCKFGIDYLIDMTNMRPDELNRQAHGKLPCLCNKQHSRAYLSVKITDTSFKSLFFAFNEINKFINQAKKSSSGRRVLIAGKELFATHVICAFAQYLMIEYEVDQQSALHILTEKFHKQIDLDKCYVDYLNQFELYLSHLSMSMSKCVDEREDSCSSEISKTDIFLSDFENSSDFIDIHNAERQLSPSESRNCRNQMVEKQLNSAPKDPFSSMDKKENLSMKIAWM